MVDMTAALTPPARLDRRTVVTAAFFCALALLPPLALWLDEPFYIRFATRVMIFGIAALSLDLVLGYGGMVSFGHAAFSGLAAYAVAILGFHGVDQAFVVWPAALAVAGAASLAIGALSLRTGGVYFIMITLAFAQMIYFLFSGLDQYGGEDGLRLAGRSRLPLIDLGDRRVLYYVVFLALAGCFVVSRRLVASRFGLILRGVAQNDRRLAALGIPTYRYRLAAFAVSGVMAGIAGVLMAEAQGFVSPADLAWTRSGEILMMVVLGGMGTLVGPVIGAAFYLVLELVLEGWTEHWPAVMGAVLIAVVLFARGGLIGIIGGRR